MPGFEIKLGKADVSEASPKAGRAKNYTPKTTAAALLLFLVNVKSFVMIFFTFSDRLLNRNPDFF
jgi:hypothetical protein